MSETAAVSFSTIAHGVMDDPYPLYDLMRARDPVHWSKEENAWVVTRYREVAEVLRNPAFEVTPLGAMVSRMGDIFGRNYTDLTSVLGTVLFFTNPPTHAEERRYMVAVLTGTPVSTMAESIEEIVAGLLAPVRLRGRLDAVREFADILPSLVLGRLLGLGDNVVRELVGLLDEVSMSFDRGRSMRFYDRVNRSVAASRSLVGEVVAERRRTPRNDGLSRMVALGSARGELDDGDLASRAIFLMAVGAETTAALIGNAVSAILNTPEAAAAIGRDATLIEAAVEETIRFDSPVQQVSRIAACELELGGQRLKQGDRVVALIGAANRDPEVFAQPERFWIERPHCPHLGFGADRHHCIGITLARLEARIALSRLLALAPTLAPGQTGARWQHRTLRRLKSLPLSIA